MDAAARRMSVAGAMPVIRAVLRMCRYDVDACSDDQLAEALLETCPDLTAFWLSDEYVRLAAPRLTDHGGREVVVSNTTSSKTESVQVRHDRRGTRRRE